MNYLAVLSYEHLDNNFFLKSFARTLARKKGRGILLHSDSEHTERIIQTGVMREDAEIRALKELNTRLVSLLADEGVSAIGIHGHQKSAIRLQGKEVIVEKKALESLPSVPLLILSGLLESDSGRPSKAPLPAMAFALQILYNIPEITIFSKKKDVELLDDGFPYKIIPAETDREFKELHVPEEFYNYDKPVILQGPTTF